MADGWEASALLQGNERTVLFTRVDLAGSVDAVVGVIPQFLPLGDPVGQAPQGEHDREHIGGDTSHQNPLPSLGEALSL